MNKNDIARVLCEETGMSMKQAVLAIDAITTAIHNALEKGDKISLLGFGTFIVVERKARTGRNPKTGVCLRISAAKAVKFKPGKGLSSAVARKSEKEKDETEDTGPRFMP